MVNKAKNSPDKMTTSLAKQILPPNVTRIVLNVRELKFIASYVTSDFNSIEAARKAGYSFTRKEFATSWANDMLRKPHIAEGIKLFIDSVIAPYKHRLEYEILDRYYRRATWTIDLFLRSDGTPKNLDEISREWVCCIDGVKQTAHGKEYILPNKDIALQMLNRMITGDSLSGDLATRLPTDSRNKMQEVLGRAQGRLTLTQIEINLERNGQNGHTNGHKPMKNAKEED